MPAPTQSPLLHFLHSSWPRSSHWLKKHCYQKSSMKKVKVKLLRHISKQQLAWSLSLWDLFKPQSVWEIAPQVATSEVLITRAGGLTGLFCHCCQPIMFYHVWNQYFKYWQWKALPATDPYGLRQILKCYYFAMCNVKWLTKSVSCVFNLLC